MAELREYIAKATDAQGQSLVANVLIAISSAQIVVEITKRPVQWRTADCISLDD